jgi:uncharacterized protein
MKRLTSFLLILFVFILPSFAFETPEYKGYVNDYTGTLSPEQSTELTTQITNFEKKSGNEIAVVLINSLEGDTVENVANQIFHTWKIGKKEKNNGILFLVALQDRKMRIEVGYGLEPELTDLESRWILDETVKPAFKENNYFEGIQSGLLKIQEAIQTPESQVVPATYSAKPSKENPIGFLLFFFFFGFQWLVSILARTKSWWLGGVLGGVAGLVMTFLWGIAFLLAVPILAILGLILDYVVSKNYKSLGATAWWAGGGSSWGSGGNDGDSFGGFGGGDSGGGGSSSSW